jgi:hypothetical protein
VRLTTSLQVGAKYFSCVVCRFHVAVDADSAPCQKPASINLQKWFLSPTGRLNLGFIIEGNLPLCLHTFLLGFPTGRLAPLTGITAETSHTGIGQKPTALHKAHGLQKGGVCKIAHGPFFCNHVKLSAMFHFSLIVLFRKTSATRTKLLSVCGDFFLEAATWYAIDAWPAGRCT